MANVIILVDVPAWIDTRQRTTRSDERAAAARYFGLSIQRRTAMAKGQQRSTKEAKKPKKDSGPPKPVAPLAPSAAITTVVPDRSKKKK
jgi:hypothetical protein